MNTNALFWLGFKFNGSSYDRSMFMCGRMVKISIQQNDRTKDWGISFDDGNIHDIVEVDEILDWVACYVKNNGDV